jgi:hypothetical protein
MPDLLRRSWIGTILALSLTFTAIRPVLAAEEQRITNGTNVRLRATPQSTAAIIFQLSLGTELSVLARSGVASESWLRVRTNDGREGWLLGRLTTPIDSTHYLQTVEGITREQLAAHAKVTATSFETRLQLFDLIERTAMHLAEREAQGRFALYRLRAMTLVLSGIPFKPRDFKTAYKPWLDAHREAVAYNSPAGAWMVEASYIREVHEEYRDTAAADDLAWFLVQNGLRGECEGDVPCYLSWQNQLNGEYLRLHPRGRHADQAAVDLARILNSIMDDLQKPRSILKELNSNTRCGELHASLDALVTAVTESSSARKADALAAIDRFAQPCR